MQIRRRPPLPDAKPHHILEEIVWHKQREVAQLYEQLPVVDLQQRVLDAPYPRDFFSAITQSSHHPSLIAEVKKASPSRGVIRAEFEPVAIAQSYERGGAACLSVLTDERFFQGSFSYLQMIRHKVSIPLLCKEFIIDPYQLYLARAAGADAVLLIAAILSNQELQDLLNIVHSFGMDALVEVHTLAELDRVLRLTHVRLVGINNRNLQDFTVDLNTTRQLLTERGEQLQRKGIVVVSESGLYTPADLAAVAQVGARVVLMGESLVKQPDVEQAVRNVLSNQTVASLAN